MPCICATKFPDLHQFLDLLYVETSFATNGVFNGIFIHITNRFLSFRCKSHVAYQNVVRSESLARQMKNVRCFHFLKKRNFLYA